VMAPKLLIYRPNASYSPHIALKKWGQNGGKNAQYH
jgi:hypothetical protein